MRARRRRNIRVTDLIASAYDSALEAKPFSSLLPTMMDAIGADMGQLALWSPELDRGELALSHEMPEHLVRAYREHFWKVDVWRMAAQRSVPVGRAATGRMLVPYPELLESEMYNDALRAYGLFDTCAGVIFARGKSGAGFSLLRARGRPFYGKRELATMDALLPHLGRAFGLRLRFERLRAEADAALVLLDRFAAGAIVLARGRIEHATPGAKRVLDAGKSIYAACGRLHARAPAIDTQLDALTSATRQGSGDAHVPRVLDVPNEHGAPALRLTILASGGACALLSLADAPMLVVIDDLARTPAPGVDAVGARFRLTPAEQRLAGHFLNGVTLREAAEREGVSLHTVRNQMKQILHKTECRRQVDLVRLCLKQRGASPQE